MSKQILAVAAGVVVLAGTVILGGDLWKAPRTPVTTATAQTSAGAADTYATLTREIETLSRQASESRSPDEQARLFGQIETKLTAFRTKYPRTPEAMDATFQLGAINYATQKYKEATGYLTEFIAGYDGGARDKVAYARFYLAESLKSSGEYDKAEAEYKVILSQYRDVNQRLTSYVETNLASLATERKLAIGKEPAGFSVKGTKGESISPAAYRGKVLLIDFWATWCGPCVQEMPNVKNVYSKYHAKGFEIVGISLDQSRAKLDAYVQQQGINWPQYFDGKYWNNDIAVMYGIKSIPATILLDRSGKIRYKSLRGKQLDTAVAQLLAEKV